MAHVRFHTGSDGRVVACSGCARCQSNVTRAADPARAGRVTAWPTMQSERARRLNRKRELARPTVREQAPDGWTWHRHGLEPTVQMPDVVNHDVLKSEREEPGPSAAVNRQMWPRRWMKGTGRPFVPTRLPAHMNLTPGTGSLRETAREMSLPQSADGGN